VVVHNDVQLAGAMIPEVNDLALPYAKTSGKTLAEKLRESGRALVATNATMLKNCSFVAAQQYLPSRIRENGLEDFAGIPATAFGHLRLSG
jgi:hypothetical protein